MKSSGPTSGRMPWEKPYTELNKYDWFTAVTLHPKHTVCPRDLRVANALFQYADKGTLVAWPGQQTIAKMAGLANTRQVRSAIANLVASGAIQTRRIDALPEEIRERLAEKMSARKPHGKAYLLDQFWAYETFEAYRHKLANGSGTEPAQLKNGKRRNRTGRVRKNRTDSVHRQPDCVSPPNTDGDTIEDTDSGREREKASLVTHSRLPAAASTRAPKPSARRREHSRRNGTAQLD